MATVGTILLFVSLGLTWAALSVTRRTAKQQLRAYVGIAKGQVGPLHQGRPIIGQICSKNAGQTPAYKFKIWYRIAIYGDSEGKLFGHGSSDGSGTSIKLPGMETIHPIKTLEAISDDDLSHLRLGTGNIYVWGKMTYLDIFGDSHTTSFRMMNEGIRGGRPDDLCYCEEGNEAD